MKSTITLLFAYLVACTPQAKEPEVQIRKENPNRGEQVVLHESKIRDGGSDWPCFLGPTSNSVSTEKGILTKWPKTGLKVAWEIEMGEGYAPPAIAKGKLYHFDRYGDKARLTCRDTSNGSLVWKYEYPTKYRDHYGYNNGPRCSPVVDDGRVYIHGADGVLACVNAADGKELWKVETAAKFNVYQNFFGVGSCPVVEGDLLIVPVGGSPFGERIDDFTKVKGNNTGIVAFDKKTGEVKYSLTDELASYSSPVLADIGGRRWGFVFARGGLVGFDPKTGKADFQFPWRARMLESVNAANPVVVGDEVLITECYAIGSALLKVKPGNAEVVWSDADKGREKSLRCHWNTPIHADGFVYGSSGRHESEAELRCVEWKTGELKWKKPGLTRSSLLLADGHFLCMAETGELVLFKVNPKEYQEVARWNTGLDSPCWAAPVLSHGMLYIRGKDRLLACELIPK